MTRLSDSLLGRQSERKGPTTPYTQRLPALTRIRFGLIRFRSPLLTEYLFLPVLRCFTSRRSLHAPYIFRCGSLDMTPAGFPHSEILGSQLVCQLPEAYRRLLRPSSAPSAKASIVCPYKLDHRYSKMLASTVQFSSYVRARQLSSAYLDQRGGSSAADGPSCRPRGQTEEGSHRFADDPTVRLVAHPVRGVRIRCIGCYVLRRLHLVWIMLH